MIRMKFNSENLNRSKFQGKERKPDAIPNIHQGLDRTFIFLKKKSGRNEKGHSNRTNISLRYHDLPEYIYRIFFLGSWDLHSPHPKKKSEKQDQISEPHTFPVLK
jgi:hypothetical protein